MRAARRPAAAARSPDRVPASDPGRVRLPLGRAPRRAGAGDEARAHRSVRGRDLLCSFRRGEGRRDAAARRHRARVRLALLRHGGRRASPAKPAEQTRPRRPRRARPLHGRLRPRAGLRRGACPSDAGDRGQRRVRGWARHPCARISDRHDVRHLRARRRLCAAQGLLVRCAHARRHHQGGERRRTARPGRRRLPDRPQVDPGACRARAAADGGQCRRGRARHLQGPALSRTRSAPFHRRDADRRLGGRSAGNLHLYPRRISRSAADARGRNRQGRRRRVRPACWDSSPSRRRRLYLRRRIRDDRIDRRQARPAQASSALCRPGRPVRPANA